MLLENVVSLMSIAWHGFLNACHKQGQIWMFAAEMASVTKSGWDYRGKTLDT